MTLVIKFLSDDCYLWFILFNEIFSVHSLTFVRLHIISDLFNYQHFVSNWKQKPFPPFHQHLSICPIPASVCYDFVRIDFGVMYNFTGKYLSDCQSLKIYEPVLSPSNILDGKYQMYLSYSCVLFVSILRGKM